jgi:hypothetical protein
MGVMVEDYTTIRHATGIADRFQAYNVGSIAGSPEPVDGFEPDVVRFGWPGTMTQTVDEALQANFPGIGQQSSDPPPYLYCDQDNGTTPYQATDITNHCFACKELSFNTVYGGGGQRRDCLVVSPCSSAEIAHPELREVLHSVADDAKGINGHYRFYAYTNAPICQDAGFNSAGPMPVYRWDVAQGKWVPIEATVFDPNHPCAPEAEQAPVHATVPVVCSSLPWLAFQNFNERQNDFRVILDSVPAGDRRDPIGCVRQVQPDPAGDLVVNVPDGLYNFTQADRANAAAIFHEGLKQQVLGSIADAWAKISHDIAVANNISATAIGAIGLVLEAIDAAAGAVVLLSAILQIPRIVGKALIIAFSDMPNHVANQICNTFAFDAAEDHTSSAWQQPNAGVAVGPDDIVWFWQPTTEIAQQADHTVIRGIYGQNRRLILQQPGYGTTAECRWAYSEGVAKFIAVVTLASNNLPVPGALVTVACHAGFTDQQGVCGMGVPSGTYWATASWQDPQTDDFLTVSQAVTIPFDPPTVPQHQFVLQPPAIEFRELDTAVIGDARKGSIWAGSPNDIEFSQTILLGPRGNPADANDTTGETGFSGSSQNYATNRTVGVSVTAQLDMNQPGYVSGTVTPSLNKENNEVVVSETLNFGPIPPGQSETFQAWLRSGGVFPDKADLTITLHNNQSYGPTI